MTAQLCRAGPEGAAARPEGCLPIQREPGWGLGKSPFERELRRGLVRGMMGRETLGGELGKEQGSTTPEPRTTWA